MLTYNGHDSWIAEELLEKRMWVDINDYNALYACIQNKAVDTAKLLLDGGMDQEAIRKYPEMAEWPALCTVYAGRGLPTALGTVNASDFDLDIMNRTGDRFLDERGVRWLSGPYQMTIAAAPAESLDVPAPFQMGHTM